LDGDPWTAIQRLQYRAKRDAALVNRRAKRFERIAGSRGSAQLALYRFRAEFRTRTAHVVAFRPIGIEELSRQRAPHTFGRPESSAEEGHLQR
jgi:hypothetical protein